MFILTLACFEEETVNYNADLDAIQRDLEALRITVNEQHNQIKTLEEEYDLLILENNTILSQNQEQQALIEDLQNDLMTHTSDFQATFDAHQASLDLLNEEDALLWTAVENLQSTSLTREMYTFDTINDLTQQVTMIYLNKPNKHILSIVPMTGQGVLCSYKYGATNWGSNYSIWAQDFGLYHKIINEFVHEDTLIPAPSPERWPWIILDCSRVGGSAASSVDVWILFKE